MILKTDKIADLLRKQDTKDPLVISPCPDLDELEKSGSTSVDLRLGTWFVTPWQTRMTHLQLAEQDMQEKLMQTYYVSFGNEYYLHPGCFALGVTIEWLRLPKDLAGYVIGKSSWGRRGLIIATAAGVHPGFKGCLTLELSNVGEIPIAISPGIKICQLCLHKVDRMNSDEIDKSEFIGQRKPTLGKIKVDAISEKLSTAYSLKNE